MTFRIFRRYALLSAALLLVSCSSSSTPSTASLPRSDTAPATVLSVPSIPDHDLAGFMDYATRALLERDPERMTQLGLGSRHDRLTPIDADYEAETASIARALRTELAGFTATSASESISAEVLRWWLRDIEEQARFAMHDYSVSFITGPHVDLPEFLTDVHPLRSELDAVDYLTRLAGLAEKLGWVADDVGAAAAAGILMPERVRSIALWQLDSFTETPARFQPLVVEYERRLERAEIPSRQRTDLVRQATEILEREVIPAYHRLAERLRAIETRSTVGVWALPDGAEYYRSALRHHLTSNDSPEDLHNWGTQEVERVRGELKSALDALGYDTTDLNAALATATADAVPVDLSSDSARSAFIQTNEELAGAALEATRDWFGLRPGADLIVRRPEASRESGVVAYYRGPDLGGTRPGVFYVSMGLPSRSSLDVATTAFHEAIPGHHFQLSIQAEAENPLHQRALVSSGFAEGWALYAERLAWEAGLYVDDPLGNVGRLQMELLRAVRVVADTGIHALKWTRDEAIDYHVANSALPRARAEAEVDRYIVWPGQAASYLVGMSAILEARSSARDALGSEFDLAAFHDELLSHGSLPLTMLPDVVAAYTGARSESSRLRRRWAA